MNSYLEAGVIALGTIALLRNVITLSMRLRIIFCKKFFAPGFGAWRLVFLLDDLIHDAPFQAPDRENGCFWVHQV